MNEAQIKKAVKDAIRASIKGDELAEKAHMISYGSAFSPLKFTKSPLTAAGEKALEAIDKALAELSDAREKLGNAVWQLQKALKEMEK